MVSHWIRAKCYVYQIRIVDGKSWVRWDLVLQAARSRGLFHSKLLHQNPHIMKVDKYSAAYVICYAIIIKIFHMHRQHCCRCMWKILWWYDFLHQKLYLFLAKAMEHVLCNSLPRHLRCNNSRYSQQRSKWTSTSCQCWRSSYGQKAAFKGQVNICWICGIIMAQKRFGKMCKKTRASSEEATYDIYQSKWHNGCKKFQNH